jgi:hypothetical protein
MVLPLHHLDDLDEVVSGQGIVLEENHSLGHGPMYISLLLLRRALQPAGRVHHC